MTDASWPAGPALLETRRLHLRPPAAADFEPWAAMLADPEVARFIGGAQNRYGAWRNLAMMIGAWELSGFGMFSVLEKASGRWIGRVGPWQPEGWPGPEIGWALRRDAWGHGYATEAARATMAWARAALGWRRAIHLVHPDTHASRVVAERLGSRPLAGYDTSLIASDVPLVVYGQDLGGRDEVARRPPDATAR